MMISKTQSEYVSTVLLYCMEEASTVEVALSATEQILKHHPAPEHSDVYLSHDISNRRAQGILNRTLQAARGMTAVARRDLAAALDRVPRDHGEAVLKFVDRYRAQLALLLTATQLAAVLEGAREVADRVPAAATFPGAAAIPPSLEPAKALALVARLGDLTGEPRAAAIYALPPDQQAYAEAALAAREALPPPPPVSTPRRATAGAPEGVHLDTIDEAARALAEKNVLTRQEYDALDAAARAKSLAVAGVDAEATLVKIRDTLSENVAEGADYEAWKSKVLDAVGTGTFLSEPHMETVFRTNIQSAISDGQFKVLNHPGVRAGFPYSTYDAIHDDRVREDHLALEKLGIGGGNVYRNDDPVFQLFRPPWDYNDRCGWTPITVRQAAERGVAEAKEWLATGAEPTTKAHVPMPDFRPPPGFARSIGAAPLSVQLSMQSMGAFAGNVTKVARSRTLALSLDVDRQDGRRLRLLSETLAILFGDGAEEVADELYGADGAPDGAALAVGNPKVKRRYGAKPGPGWHPGGTSRLGTQIWVYGGAPSSPAPAPSPATAAPPPPPPPPPAVHTSPAPPVAAPAPSVPAPSVPTPTAVPFTPVTLPAGTHKARAASVTAYNNAMAAITYGGGLTSGEKATLARQLTNMPTGLLRNLHAALGGTGATGNAKAAVAAVRAILTGATAAPPSAPTPAPAPPPQPPPAPPAPSSAVPTAGAAVLVGSGPHTGKIGTVISVSGSLYLVDLGGGTQRYFVASELTVQSSPAASPPPPASPLSPPAPPPPPPPPPAPPALFAGLTTARAVNQAAIHFLYNGGTLTATEKAVLTTHLPKMTKRQLSDLYKALGGILISLYRSARKSYYVGRVTTRVNSAPTAPAAAPTPASAPAPAATPVSMPVLFSTGYTPFDTAVNDVLAGKTLTSTAILNAVSSAYVSVSNPDVARAVTALGGAVTNRQSSFNLSQDLQMALQAKSAANTTAPPPAPPPPLIPPGAIQPVSALAALPAHLQGKAAAIRAIALAHTDGLISLADADARMRAVGGTLPDPADQSTLVAALGSKTAVIADVIAAVSAADPGHVGPSPPGPPPRPGLVWNPSTHRWILAPQAASPPPPPPTPAPAGKLGAHYAPPPPNVAALRVGPYGGTKPGNLAGIPPTVDHTAVGSFPKTVGSLSADFSDTSPAAGSLIGYGGTIAQFAHGPSGYAVRASWKYGAPTPGSGNTAAPYTIKVLDGAGQVVSEYSSSAARDEAYVRERAVQVAHWIEGELAKVAKQKSPATTAPLAQFAWEYAQAAGVKPGAVPFDLADPSPHGSANRKKMEGYLKAAFPKLVGAKQHAPHGGMDVVEHTMNIVHPANLRAAGLPARDADILRLGMLYHDVGKQYDPQDHDHPRKSAEDAEPLLWQFGLSPREVADTLAVIKWHDTYGDQSRQAGGAAVVARQAYQYTDDSLPPDVRRAQAKRINNLLMRAFQSDVSSIPGLTSKPVPGRPDLKVSGTLDVDVLGPAFEAKVSAEIDAMAKPPKSLPLPKQPATVAVGTAPPDLVAPGLKWGELVQRTEALPVGQPVPHGSTKVPPPEVYDEARKHPECNFARAFNMGYDGPTGQIVTVYHGTNRGAAGGMLSTGPRAGNSGNNVFGHGIYAFLNGANNMDSNYQGDHIVTMEVHTGRMIDHGELERTVVPAFAKAEPALYKKLTSDYTHTKVNAVKTAAALWAGYTSISLKYYQGDPAIVVLDPARVRPTGVVGSKHGGYKGTAIKTTSGTVTTPALTNNQKNTPAGHDDHVPLSSSGKPKGWSGTARTT